MEENHSFIEFIRHLCRQPSMYTGGTLKETIAFINGYRFGKSTPISDRDFDRFVCIKNSFPANCVWYYVIESCVQKEEDGFKLIEETIIEFVNLKDTLSEKEILGVAASQVREEGEAEKTFRAFDKALLMGKEDVIKPLIMFHSEAHILWEGAYSSDVAFVLNEISSNEPIRSIPISDNGDKVKIIAQGWPFPIEMNLINGAWKINAANIIELRKET